MKFLFQKSFENSSEYVPMTYWNLRIPPR